MSKFSDSDIESVEFLLGDRYVASSEPSEADDVASEFFSSEDDYGSLKDFVVR